jgi:uncharacterized protein (TIGR03437 family)
VDSLGNVYIADTGNNRIRKVSDGVITTIAGNGTPGYAGDNGPAISAQLNGPKSLFVDAPGNVFAAEPMNNRVRLIAKSAASLFSTVSAASLAPASPSAPGVIAAGYGVNLAPTTEIAQSSGALPTVLAQTSVTIQDSAGVELIAPLWFVSPNQINYYIPEQTALGPATVSVTRNSLTVASGTLQIDRVAPGIFTMNANGRGVPAGLAIKVSGSGSQTWEYVFIGPFLGVDAYEPAGLDLGGPTDQLVLQLYGTGIRGRSSLAAVTATIGGVNAPVTYAGPVSGMIGLDQVNISVPRSLAGRLEVDVVLSVDGRSTNTVRIFIV